LHRLQKSFIRYLVAYGHPSLLNEFDRSDANAINSTYEPTLAPSGHQQNRTLITRQQTLPTSTGQQSARVQEHDLKRSCPHSPEQI